MTSAPRLDSAQALVSVLIDMREEALHRLLSQRSAGAAIWVKAAAWFGLPAAQMRLGRMYLDGWGVERDPGRALAWFRRAAEAGDADGMNMIGRCFECGWGVAASAAAAAPWYRSAAEKGDAWAQYNLGHLLLDGNGVARDRDAAFRWYRAASDQGHARAMNLLARCHEEGWGTQRDPAQARHWYRSSAEGGYFRGQYNYATLLAAEGSVKTALALFEAAARGAPAETRSNMIGALVANPSPSLSRLGRRLKAQLC